MNNYSRQDMVLAVSILVFNVALIPSVFSKSKPSFSTSFVTAVFLTATVVVYLSLSLWYTAVMGAINTILWSTLAFQKFRQAKNK